MCRLQWSMVTLSAFPLIWLLTPALKADGAEGLRFAHSRSAYADGQGLPLKKPEGVACGAALAVVADTRNGRLVRYSLSAEGLKEGIPIKTPQVPYPVRVHIDSKGDILVLDGKVRRLARLKPDGTFLAYLDPKGVPKGNIVTRSFALDREDRIYFLDIFSRRVLVTDSSGNYQQEMPFPEKSGFISDLAVDPKGTVFLLDSVSGSLFAAEKGKDTFTLLTKELKDYANFPTHVATDGKGTLYVVDQNGGGVILVGQDGSYRGRQLSTGWKEGLLYYPAQMCVSGGGEIAVIADRENDRVQVFKVIR